MFRAAARSRPVRHTGTCKDVAAVIQCLLDNIYHRGTGQLALHQGTARSLGLRFPQSLLVRADEVIQ